MARKSWIEKLEEYLHEKIVKPHEEVGEIHRHLYEVRKQHRSEVDYHAIEDVVMGVCIELCYKFLIYGKIKLQNERDARLQDEDMARRDECNGEAER